MQRLQIKGFLGIKNADIKLNGVTVIIGPQASGKSIVARLFYFFNEYFADFDELPLIHNEHKKIYDSGKRQDFSKIFPSYSWQKDQFLIKYTMNQHSVQIESERGSSSIKITTSHSVGESFRRLKKAFNEFSETYDSDFRASSFRKIRDFKKTISQKNSHLSFEHSLFVPASRSFYATMREEIFSILSIDDKFDKIMMQFGDFYETAKKRLMFRDLQGARYKPHARYFNEIVKGKYAQIDGRDWLIMDRGQIELSKASSGQQEAVPLLMALSLFPQPNRTLIIEEPEAHLFPTAQASILDFIVRQSTTYETSIFLTTHSPYLLSALNNYILRGIKRLDGGFSPESIFAYSLQDGKAETIIDPESNLISAEYIDDASDVIYKDFLSIIETEETD